MTLCSLCFCPLPDPSVGQSREPTSERRHPAGKLARRQDAGVPMSACPTNRLAVNAIELSVTDQQKEEKRRITRILANLSSRTEEGVAKAPLPPEEGLGRGGHKAKIVAFCDTPKGEILFASIRATLSVLLQLLGTGHPRLLQRARLTPTLTASLVGPITGIDSEQATSFHRDYK